jgi:uncharacterized protein (DUF697 family)
MELSPLIVLDASGAAGVIAVVPVPHVDPVPYSSFNVAPDTVPVTIE